MPIFSFIGYTLTELFRILDNWRQIYKQMSSTFYTSNDVSKTCWEEKILGRQNKVARWLFNFFWKNAKAATWDVLYKSCSLQNFLIFTGWKVKHLLLEYLFNSPNSFSTYFEDHLRTAASENVFMKLRKTQKYS